MAPACWSNGVSGELPTAQAQIIASRSIFASPFRARPFAPILRVVKIEQISMDCASGAEGLDAMEEIRYLFELADDGGVDLGPAVRSLLANAYFAVDRELQSEACA